MVLSPALQTAIARPISAPAVYGLLQHLFGRLFGGFILCFHNLPAERFVEHIEALRPNRPVHLGEILEREAQGKPTGGLFAITFDDGVGDTIRAIAGVCRQRQWPVSFYLPTGYLDDPFAMPFQWLANLKPLLPQRVIDLPSRRLDLSAPGSPAKFNEKLKRVMYTRPRREYVPIIMELVSFILDEGLADRRQLEPPPPVSWAEVSQLSRDPLVRFESHGVSHSAVVALEDHELEHELKESQKRISEHTNRKCEHFCYPFGGAESIGTRAPRIAAKYYKSAVTGTRRRLRAHDPLLVPRIALYPKDGSAVARLKVLTR